MSTYRVIRLVGSSPNSWEEAARSAVEEAAQHLEDLRVAEVELLDMRMMTTRSSSTARGSTPRSATIPRKANRRRPAGWQRNGTSPAAVLRGPPLAFRGGLQMPHARQSLRGAWAKDDGLIPPSLR